MLSLKSKNMDYMLYITHTLNLSVNLWISIPQSLAAMFELFFRATEAADCKARNDDTKSLTCSTHCNLEDHSNVHISNCPTKPTNFFKLQKKREIYWNAKWWQEQQIEKKHYKLAATPQISLYP